METYKLSVHTIRINVYTQCTHNTDNTYKLIVHTIRINLNLLYTQYDMEINLLYTQYV